MFFITLMLLCSSVATAVIGGLLIDYSAKFHNRNACAALTGCAMLAAGLYASIYYAMALTQ